MKYLLFFTALIATANALVCQCSGSACTEATCTIEGGKCYSTDTEITTGKDEPLKATMKGCQDSKAASNICTRGFVILSSEKDFNLMSNVACCDDKDSCNTDLVAPLDKTIPESNLVCPSCFALAKTCDAKSMTCNNLQKKCFNIAGTVKKGEAAAQDFIAKGCAVENNIYTKDATLTFGTTSYKINSVELQDAKAKPLVCQCVGSACKEATCTVEGGKCYSTETEITTGKDAPLKATIKGCQDSKAASNICTRGFVILSSEKDFNLMSNVACCGDKDSCNKDLVAPLNKTIPESNLVCPSCFALAKTCDAKSMKCNNLQKKCFNIAGTVKKGEAAAQDFIAKGCAVENNIYTKDATLTFGTTSYKINSVELQDAKGGASQISSCLSFAILLPSVLWFLLDRSLY